MLPQKMDADTVKELRNILRKVNITYPRVIIDFNQETVEMEETGDCSVDDLLQSAGVLSPERIKELKDEVGRMREDWDR
ncbi:hypothetical protein [Cohnella fermenti]|uniref:Uncharacterized protein n=1 Tax=Cohnella fermenti TaxID=2565925 RepID=A0A4S4BL27_9BACL|nr:hypothetical protein [Cohnella fermenti]THF75365.1 hypothetical protein E6C55_22215 [Cohnella fermenti]